MKPILTQVKINKIWMNAVKSFFVAFALMNLGNFSTTSIISVCIFAGCFIFLQQLSLPYEKKDFLYANITATVFTFLFVIGYQNTLTGDLSNGLFIFVYLTATVIGLFVVFRELLLLIIHKSTTICIFEEAGKFNFRFFFGIIIILLVCMIPFFLMNYPAVMTPDSLSQYRQAIGSQNYSDHHPWLHTMLFKLCYSMGYAVSGDIYFSIAIYTIVQMIVVAVAESYVIVSLYEMGMKKKWCILSLFVFILYPFNLIYAVTIWKDILFSVSVMVLTLTIFRLCLLSKESKSLFQSKRDSILFIVSGFFMCMFRHNGLYAFIVLAIILFFVFKRQVKSYFLMVALIMVACVFIKGPVMNACNVTSGEYAYKLCIPLQQIGRVVANNRQLTDEEVTTLEKINGLNYVKENYQEGGADPMFAWVLYGNQEYLIEHQAEYAKLWISIGLRYPKDYFDAFVDQTRGYWYPMAPEQVTNTGITENEDGLLSQPLLKGPVFIKINELLEKFYTIIPIYGIYYSMGAMFWFLLLGFAICIYNHKLGMTVSFLPVFLLTLTLFIAVPLVADMRYGYPLVLTMPLIAAITFYKENSTT